MKVPIFVINLQRSPGRREQMQKALSKLDLPFEFFEAIDGLELSDSQIQEVYDHQSRLNERGRGISKTEVACYLSHTSIFKKMVEHSMPAAIVMEDDLVIEPDLKPCLSSLAKKMGEWEFVRLAGIRKVKMSQKFVALCNNKHEFQKKRRLYRPLNTCSGLQCYAISLLAAKKILNTGFPITRQIDIFIDEYWRSGIDILAVQPYPVRLNESIPTDMHHLKEAIDPVKMSLGMRIKDSKRKLVNSFAKRWVNFWRKNWPILKK